MQVGLTVHSSRRHFVARLNGTSRAEQRNRRSVIPHVGEQVTIEVLEEFADAWNRHDVDALMAFMTEDCVFEASAGPDICGTRYVGREAVRTGFAGVWATFPDAQWGNARHFICGARGVSEWTFTGTHADGTYVEAQICLRAEMARLR